MADLLSLPFSLLLITKNTEHANCLRTALTRCAHAAWRMASRSLRNSSISAATRCLLTSQSWKSQNAVLHGQHTESRNLAMTAWLLKRNLGSGAVICSYN